MKDPICDSSRGKINGILILAHFQIGKEGMLIDLTSPQQQTAQETASALALVIVAIWTTTNRKVPLTILPVNQANLSHHHINHPLPT
jgi:hypothetical protein